MDKYILWQLFSFIGYNLYTLNAQNIIGIVGVNMTSPTLSIKDSQQENLIIKNLVRHGNILHERNLS